MNSPGSHKLMAAAWIAAGIFLVLVKSPALAQRSPSSIQRRVDQLNKQGEQFERDNLGREVKGGSAKNARQRSEALAKVKKDLEVLQASYNRIVLAMAARKSANDPQVIHEVVEINACSTRLKHSLALPQPKEDPDGTSYPDGGTPEGRNAPSLWLLRKHIYSFLMSPMFETPAVVNVEQAKSASRDLDQIIELSESIARQGHGKPGT